MRISELTFLVPSLWRSEMKPLSPGDCVTKGKTEKNVMLNLLQHPIESNTYETLARSDERM